MPSTIQIKRSLLTANASSLANGELAFTSNGDVLWIGANGVTTGVPIAGRRTPGVLTANQALVANSTSYLDVVRTANLFINTFTINTINAVANSTVLGVAANNELTTTWAIKTYVDGKVAGAAGSPGGANTQVQFNDSGTFLGAAGFTFDKTTNNIFFGNTVSFGNSTVNSVANSIIHTFQNATSIANVSPSGLVVGTSVVNTTAVGAGIGSFTTSANVGANVSLSTVQLFAGNTTANLTANSILVSLSNSTSIANLSPLALTIGSAVVNSTVLTIGTGNFSTGANVGANVNISTVRAFIGNTTANLNANSILISLANSTSIANLSPIGLTVGTTVANGTTISVQDITVSGNLVINGTLTNINATNLSVTDPLIKLANGNATTDTLDVGFFGSYGNSTVTSYTGLFRDASDDKYKLFKFLQVEPTTTVNIGGAGYVPATLVAAIESSSATITGGTITGITDLAVADGGTGLSAFTAGAVLYASGTTTIAGLSGTDGQLLQLSGTTPVFAMLDGGTF